jgi:hypothetical protein
MFYSLEYIQMSIFSLAFLLDVEMLFMNVNKKICIT